MGSPLFEVDLVIIVGISISQHILQIHDLISFARQLAHCFAHSYETKRKGFEYRTTKYRSICDRHSFLVNFNA